MTTFTYSGTALRVHWRQWLRALILGIAIGTAVLGVGGRVAMRGIAVANGQAGGFSLGETLTVVFLGAVSGAAGGLILALAHQLFSRRPWVRGLESSWRLRGLARRVRAVRSAVFDLVCRPYL